MNEIQQILFSELKKRKTKNSRYSLRAFSKYLGISPAYLSLIMSGKRLLPVSKIQKIAHKLDLEFSLDVENKNKTNKASKLNKSKYPGVLKKVMPNDQFLLISDWTHYAIMSLSYIRNHKADSRWIAHRLGINDIQAKESLQRLIDLNLITVSDNKIFVNKVSTSTSEDIPSVAIKKFHRDMLKLAGHSLDTVSTHLREYSTIVMSFKEQDIKIAKNTLRKFQEEFASRFESTSGDQVYSISLQFFPITKNGDPL